MKFITSILQKYFEDDYQEYEKSKSKEQEKKMSSNTHDDYPNKRRNQILAGVFAAVAMMTYAFSTGIVQVIYENYTNIFFSTPECTDMNLITRCILKDL